MNVDEYLNFITNLRRELHANPELGNLEFKTQKTIIKNLESLNILYKKVDTGIIAYLNLNKPKTLAFRADMDALPIMEANDVPYKSHTDGIMHACGHDGHMAILLTFIKWAIKNKDKINSNLKFIFQPAEESIGGAEKMITAGVLEKVDEIYAIHLDPEMEGGFFGLKSGLSMAGVLEFDVEFFGKSCHVADYKNGSDALKACAEFLNSSLPDVFEGSILHFGKIAGGCARNVVADYCKLDCTFRFFKKEHKDEFINFLDGALKNLFVKYGVSFKINVVAGYPPLVNDEACIEKIRKISKSIDIEAKFSAEDFAYYLEKCKGSLVWLGVKEGKSSGLHSADFDFKEKYLLNGVELFAKLACID